MVKTTDRRLAPILFLALAVSVLMAATLLARPAFAGNIAVTTRLDEDNTDGDCSLREAIIAANTDAPRDACAAGAGVDNISVPAGAHKVSLAGGKSENAALTADATVGDLDVTGLTVITGAGARETTILAGTGFDDRVFDVSGNTAIFDLTISGGNPDGFAGYQRTGGGIRNEASDLTLSEVVVDDNSAYAGGGIAHQGGNLNIFRSTLSNNTTYGDASPFSGSGDGGALMHSGTEITMTNSTIADNTTDGDGGAIYDNGEATTITNSTIANNTAAGTAGAIGGSDSDLEFENTIVAKNFDAVPGTGTDDCDGFVTSLGNNLESFDTCGFDQPTDLTDIDPNLGSLRDNGGPTDTLALLAGSRAVDAASNAGCPATDQRGEARPADGDGDGTATCDIGAFERETPPDTTAPTVEVVEPAEDAPNVGRSKVVEATFSEAMKASSINTDTFELFEAGAATPVEATVGYDAAEETATLDPDAKLERGTRYKAIITSRAEDKAGNRLDQDPGAAGNQRKAWFFTVRD